jgi:tRNA nucleotidyltransferase (CCA-adding enzyme)
MKIPLIIMNIAKEIDRQGGKSMLVGGFVRDYLLGLKTKDYDIEIFGIPNLDALKIILKKFGRVNEVGKSFAILKFNQDGIEADFSFPRTEVKTGKGHKGFDVDPDPKLSYKEAASRRDFTINSMGINILTSELSDPFDGQKDLDNKLLRHIGPAFKEDPLRVLRALQFAARFDLAIHSETMKICRECDLNELPKERIFDELKKLFLKAEKPSIGFSYMQDLGVLKIFPELEKLIGTVQDPKWHPEGDVWTHNLMVIDEMAKLIDRNDEKKSLVLMLAAVCHDFGKPSTTEFIEGRWRSRGHEREGVQPTKEFLNRLTNETNLIEDVCLLVKHHLKPALLYNAALKDKVTNSALRRLAVKVSIEDLVTVAKADHFGRGTDDAIGRDFPAGKWILERASNLNIKNAAPKPILLGRHLIDLGFQPGPFMGEILNRVFEMQLDGDVFVLGDAIAWVKENYK